MLVYWFPMGNHVDDEVWVLGDISWYGATKTMEVFGRLKGRKFLCAGNHDGKLLRNDGVRGLFGEVVDYKEITVRNTGVVLCHYPIPCYNGHFRGWVHLYGHVHVGDEWAIMKACQREIRRKYTSRMYNVGCMVPGMDYTPRTLTEILGMYEVGDGQRE